MGPYPLKVWNSERSVFHARGPRKNARAFEFIVSIIDVSRDVRFGEWIRPTGALSCPGSLMPAFCRPG